MRFVVEDFRAQYVDVIKHIIEHGSKVSPRGMETREILDAVLIVQDPTNVLLTGINRKLNTKLAALESLQLVGGFIDPQLMVKAAPNTAQFMDHGSFLGAYGPRVRPQLPAVVRRLQNDLSTRQAIVQIWDPASDLYVDGVKDYPCTIMLQFLIRDDKLILHTTMRSNDIWWGIAYDLPMFTALQLSVANALDIEPGPYHHHAISLHVYERDLDAIVALTAPSGQPMRLHGLQGWTIEVIMTKARAIAEGEIPLRHLTETEQWYARALQALRSKP